MNKHINLSGVNLNGAELCGVNLSGADLSYANLREANLEGANLRGTDLTGADLTGTNLRDANLRHACLRGANLCGANLYGANLRGADLSGTNLAWAHLGGARLSGAILDKADLTNAVLYDANFYRADLRGANLAGVKTFHTTRFFHLACPEEGSFVAYKKIDISKNSFAFKDGIIKILIPEDAKRSSGTTYKCRASKVIPLAILNDTGEWEPLPPEGVSSTYDRSFKYYQDQPVEVLDYDDDRWVKCSTGIHFFMNLDSAKTY